MAKRDLNWQQASETSILRDEAKESQQGPATQTQPATTEKEAAKERTKHRLTVDIYEDQFMALEIRKARRVAGTVTDQIREALDRYLSAVGESEKFQEGSQ